MNQLKSRLITILLCWLIVLSCAAAGPHKFTQVEQQQIFVATPGLFSRSNAFSVDFSALGKADYSFPLPVGKARVVNGQYLEIETTKGDAVKAMFAGTVRLSRQTVYGNTVVVRHDNGLETVYGYNAQNLVKVGDRVRAGQTVAIVGTKDGQARSIVAILVNGAWVNPETVLDAGSHRVIRQTLTFQKDGNYVKVASSGSSRKRGITSLDPDDAQDDPFERSSAFELDLEKIEKQHWSYPLPGSRVISPYGGKRSHGGVDIKTKPNDEILAAFDGVVTRSGPYFGYGNCIVIRHAYGFETLYSHQSKNFVKVGDRVKAGQVIGLTGRTGRATTEHLHFETHFKGRRFNPAILFDHASKQLQAATLRLDKSGRVSSKKH